MSRESCCILNLSKADVRCRLTLYFPDAEPVRGIEVTVGAERYRHVRFDRADELAGARVPRGVPDDLAIESDCNVVVQHSRLDSRERA